MKIEDTLFVYRLGASTGGAHTAAIERSPASADRLSWHGRYHAHGAAEFELHFFLEGSGSFLCNRTKYPISGGRLFLTGPREFHSIIPEDVSVPLTYYAVLFNLDDLPDSGLPDPGLPDGKLLAVLRSALATRSTVLSVDPKFRFQFEDLLEMSKSADPGLRESALYLLTSFLFRWFCRQNPARAENEAGRTNRLHAEKALALMQKSVRENALIEDFARKLGLSEEHFIRIFRDEVHMTPHQYFMRLKIEGASGLLVSTDRAIGDISAWFGFENQFHFSRVFRKCTGMSPVEYRRTYVQTVDFT
jgi:AraC-like DNA-binding protein